MNTHIDVRGVLPAIRVPTLVLHRTDDADSNVEEGRWLAARIPGARFVELPGQDHLPWVGDADSVLDEIEEFLTGLRRGPWVERVLTTVLFTDVVGSTARAGELGDRGWRELLDEHSVLVRQELARFRGHEVDTAGDGFLATFDGPARAVQCGVAVTRAVRAIGLEVRAGVHTGEVELAGAGEVLASDTVKALVSGSGIEFEDRGEHELKGVPERRRLYAVTAA